MPTQNNYEIVSTKISIMEEHMKRKRSVKHLTKAFIILLVVVMLMTITTPALANSEQLGTITTNYVYIEHQDDTEGRTLFPSRTRAGRPRSAPEIERFEFIGYVEELTHVFSRQHLVYIQGYPDGTVRPENELTRAEAAMIFYRLSHHQRRVSARTAELSLLSASPFSDVSRGDWFSTAVITLYHAGVIRASDDNLFRPNESITRQDLAVMAARLDNLYCTESRSVFSDVQTGHWATPYIHGAAEVGWLVGYPDGTFRPANPIIRAEVVTLINRVLMQTLRPDQVPPGVNPYSDLVSSHWAYGDIIEASVLHDTIAWHGTAFNDGEINTITSHFVDEDGNQIADSVTQEGETRQAPRTAEGYVYYGYVVEITYIYRGLPIPSVTKQANVSEAEVGDTITYTLTARNDSTAAGAWLNVRLTDPIPAHLTFVNGSVYMDGHSHPYHFSNRVLTIELGDIVPGAEVSVTFNAVIRNTAYGQTIINTVVAEGDNGEDSSNDDGVDVALGAAQPHITKAVSTPRASVGDTITYTITVGNAPYADYPWQTVVLRDTIPAGLTFANGSVYVGGRSHPYQFSNRVLIIELGNIAPGRELVVSFSAIVNNTAFGQTIFNTVVAEGENGEDEAEDNGVTINDGVVSATVTKSVDRANATVGETLTYTVRATNSPLSTSPWRNVVMTDVIPEGLSFVDGSVSMTVGTTAMVPAVHFSAATRTLTIQVGNIPIGETATIQFRAVVNEGMQGRFVQNTAILVGDDDREYTGTDTGTRIESGTPAPRVTKSSAPSNVSIGDTVRYTIVASNAITATAPWRNAIAHDTIPDGFHLVLGSILVDGAPANFTLSGSAVSVRLGDLVPGESRTITIDVTAAQPGFYRNTVVVGSDNAPDQPATDDGVTIETPGSDVPGSDADSRGFTGTKTPSRLEVEVRDTFTYTIAAINPADSGGNWYNVVLTDPLPISYLRYVSGSARINGVLAGNRATFLDSTLTVQIGTIAPGQTVYITFDVQVATDAFHRSFINIAYLRGSTTPLGAQNATVRVVAPAIFITGSPPPTISDHHYQLFQGYPDGTWRPNNPLTRAEAAQMLHRVALHENLSPAGTSRPVPADMPTWAHEAVMFFLNRNAIGLSNPAANLFGPGEPVTGAEFIAMAAVVRADITTWVSGTETSLTRLRAAEIMIHVQGRSLQPNLNGHPHNIFSDVPFNPTGRTWNIVTEVSTEHDWIPDGSGGEIWTSSRTR